jgi:hypothetical protein
VASSSPPRSLLQWWSSVPARWGLLVNGDGGGRLFDEDVVMFSW